jgi:membrane protein
VRGIVHRARREDVVLTAAGLGFYALVSIAPIVVLSMWVTSLLLGDDRLHRLGQELSRVAPEGIGADQALQQVAEQGTRLGLAAAVLGLWPATSYGSGLVRAFDRICPDEDRERTPMRGRLLTLLVLLPAFTLGSILLAFAGGGLLGDGGLQEALGIGLAIVGAFVGAAVGSLLIFVVFPPDRMPWRKILKATLVASIGISLVTLALVGYVSFAANFQEHYASSGLAAVVLLAVWLFVANVMLLVGYETAISGEPDRR